MNAEPLPGVVRILQTVDMLEPTSCPHCGATGRVIVEFECHDRRIYRAMRGCFGKWPKSPLFKHAPWKLERWVRGDLEIKRGSYRGRPAWVEWDPAEPRFTRRM